MEYNQEPRKPQQDAPRKDNIPGQKQASPQQQQPGRDQGLGRKDQGGSSPYNKPAAPINPKDKPNIPAK